MPAGGTGGQDHRCGSHPERSRSAPVAPAAKTAGRAGVRHQCLHRRGSRGRGGREPRRAAATSAIRNMDIVLTGRATFTVDGEEMDVPAGSLVHLADPALRRHAVAAEPATTVLAIGGKPGEGFRPSAWEHYFEAGAAQAAGDAEERTSSRPPDWCSTRTTPACCLQHRLLMRHCRAIRTRRSRCCSGRSRSRPTGCERGRRTTRISTRCATGDWPI